MSLDEYKALCTIPLGFRIQWLNILQQLSMPSVDFKKVETGLTVLQSIFQAGPPQDGNVLRASHELVNDQAFGDALLRSLNESLNRVRENWESSQAVCTFISVSARLLSLSNSEDIKARCLTYLRDARAITFDWVNLLTDKVYEASDDSHRAELHSRAAENALICADSFNVDDEHLDRVFDLPEDRSIFVQVCIVIHNGTSTIEATSDHITPILHQRWMSLCYRSYPILVGKILNVRHQFLDDAIRKAWSPFVPGDGWRIVSTELDYWLVNSHSPRRSEKPVVVHYNLLTGELLVAGLPFARLPTRYLKHSTHRTLFGRVNLEVMPGTVTGMQFSGKRAHAGYTVHLGMRPLSGVSHLTGSDLLVRAVKDGQTYDFVPAWVFDGGFPVHFTESFVHWYNVSDDSVEFRPIEDPWHSSPDHWKLVRVPGNGRWRLVKDGMSLISVGSDTAVAINNIFSPLESPLHSHAVLLCSSTVLEIELPRLSLSFLLKSGTSKVRSKQFRGSTVDPNQSLGTLVGLHSKLMLQNEMTGQRLILLPEGVASCQKTGDHVQVTISHDAFVKAHAYPVDEQLGRLLDNGTLQSKLWLCYLHAITSFCLPDPLTMRTGTEQALSILDSAAVRSFDRLAEENVNILQKIALLAAGRRYYPSTERVMQTVEWAPELGFLAQYGRLYQCVKLIFDDVERASVFYPDFHIQLPALDHVEPDLLDRDLIRSSTFRVSGFGAEDHTTNFDATYPSRDQGQDSSEGIKAAVMADFVFQGHPTMPYNFPMDLSAYLWRFLKKQSQILGPNSQIPLSELRYDSNLLKNWDEIVIKYWCNLHQTLSNERPRVNNFRLMIFLATLAFAKDSKIEVVQALGSFFVLSRMAQISPPAISSSQVSEGATFRSEKLRAALRSAFLPFAKCPESKLSRGSNESQFALKQRQQRQFQSNQDRSLNRLLQELDSQWPCESPVSRRLNDFSTYFNIDKVSELTRPKFKTWYENYRLHQYLCEVEDALQGVAVILAPTSSPRLSSPCMMIPRRRTFISVQAVFTREPPLIDPRGSGNSPDDFLVLTDTRHTAPRLPSLLEDLESLASSNFERGYVADLRESLQSFQNWDKRHKLLVSRERTREIFSGHLTRCAAYVQKVYEMLLSAADDVDRAVVPDTGHRPQLCPIFFLQQLSRPRWLKLKVGWRRCIVQYALALAELQRANRLVNLSESLVDLVKELCNPGHTNWDPFEQPESLLLEVESGCLIRGVQADIARQMKDVAENATMQLNMGEGKSSMIVPVVASALADGSRLVRIVTTKPQEKQMFHTLVSKLGGLLSRRVYRMPVSRSLQPSEADALMLDNMCHECMETGGVLLVQPEHVLSFKLMGLECLITGKTTIGRSILHTQRFFEASSRDIVDESDENFNVKFELIYTMGTQRPIELSPQRWIWIQRVLGLVKTLAPQVASEFPCSMEVHECSPGRFPRTRIFDDNAQWLLFDSIAKRICEDGLHDFPIARQPRPVREAVFRYLTEPSLSAYEISRVESQEPGGFWSDSTSRTLLLMRGLLGVGVLAFAFREKRWRVQYGLDAIRKPRTKLAVPYRAKDSPALRSEFSHPDVVIVLTCLSYYYGGIEDDDLFLAFDHLLKSDQGDVEYQEWVKDAPCLPTAFRQLSGINLKDRVQCVERIFPPLRYAKNTIDYFLTHLVFPKEMREFPHKLSASGWDIGQIKTHPTSGFSGTNDSRLTLPLGVKHLDLEEQKHTNALVLERLLQPEHSIIHIPAPGEPYTSTTERLLDMISRMEPPVQVILDVGAQLLEASNRELAREWLKTVQEYEKVQAAVFFNEDDDLCVLDRNGRTELLQISPFADQLDVCLIFLDEAHTRGTDLKLPEYYRAAVTLGANLTKDRMIQACMRMRKLGHGQSVVFCIPEEIRRKILSRKRTPDDMGIGVTDVLCWAITETWGDVRRSMPLWALQGRRFESQQNLWTATPTDGLSHMPESLATKFLEPESQSLEHRYRPGIVTHVMPISQAEENENLQHILHRCLQFDNLEHHAASLQEEQERELSPEIMREREVQRPPPAEPATHHIHPELNAFVVNGILQADSEAFKPAFETLRSTSAATHIDLSQFPTDVFVTIDFASTIQRSGQGALLDAYQRPVQWVLTSVGSSCNNTVKHMVIISPYEAQMLQTDIRRSKRVRLHLYAPRLNLGLRSMDRLDLYVISGMPTPPIIPPSFITQLNLFAGQLYLGRFEDYVKVCAILGLAWQNAEDGSIIAADGFIIRDRSGRATPASKFSKSPVTFLRVFLTKIRRNCEEIDKTHLGAILGGRLLHPADFGEPDHPVDTLSRSYSSTQVP